MKNLSRIPGSVKMRKLIFRVSHQQGVVMILVLISLVILLIAGVSLMRSSDTSLTISGNLAFKRDATNQSERAISLAKNKFNAGGILYDNSGEQDSLGDNYSATILASNSMGIPNVLLNSSLFTTFTAPDISDSANNIVVRYVIDRMCVAAGPATDTNCSLWTGTVNGGSVPRKKVEPSIPIYRISVLTTGPRNTQAFVQTTFKRDK
jgi:type IV pilus assembly protein PilX